MCLPVKKNGSSLKTLNSTAKKESSVRRLLREISGWEDRTWCNGGTTAAQTVSTSGRSVQYASDSDLFNLLGLALMGIATRCQLRFALLVFSFA